MRQQEVKAKAGGGSLVVRGCGGSSGCHIWEMDSLRPSQENKRSPGPRCWHLPVRGEISVPSLLSTAVHCCLVYTNAAGTQAATRLINWAFALQQLTPSTMVSIRGTSLEEPAGLFPGHFAMGKSRVRLSTNRIRVKIVHSIKRSTRKKVLPS